MIEAYGRSFTRPGVTASLKRPLQLIDREPSPVRKDEQYARQLNERA